MGAIVANPTRGNVTSQQYRKRNMAAFWFLPKQAFLCTRKQSHKFELLWTRIGAVA